MAWQTYEMPLENFLYFMRNPSQSMKMRMKAEEVHRYENLNEIFMKCSYDILLQLMSEAQHLNEWET